MKIILDDGKEIELEKIQVLEVKENDVLVATAKWPISKVNADHTIYILKKVFGESTKVIVFDNEMSFKVIRTEGNDIESIRK